MVNSSPRPEQIVCVLALSLLAICTANSTRADILAFNGFETGLEGWSAADYSIPGSANPPAWIQPVAVDDFSTGGNPDGYISADPQGALWWCFVAPPAYLGNKVSAFGGFIQFDRWSIDVDLGPRPGLFLVGAGMTLSHVIPAPTKKWETATVPLLPAGWRVNHWATGPEPTEAQMKAVLASLDHMLITGQWSTLQVTLTSLDNVQLAGPPASDIDLDGSVDGDDLGLLLAVWGPCPAPCDADLNGDGTVDGADLGMLLANWGEQAFVGCPAATHDCYVQGDKGCNDVVCCAAVCQNDSRCCTTAWDAFCVTLATEQCAGCGNPSAGDCCAFHEAAYCSNAACCAAVCATSPFCCDQQWDDGCVDTAVKLEACNCGG